jgi:hypothetical protein
MVSRLNKSISFMNTCSVERMMGGIGGLGGQATHGGTGGTGGHGQGARLIDNLKAEKVVIHNHGDAEGVKKVLDMACGGPVALVASDQV